MSEFRKGDLVEYRPGDGSVERGFVTSANKRFVFVRFGAELGSKACDPRDITRARLTQ